MLSFPEGIYAELKDGVGNKVECADARVPVQLAVGLFFAIELLVVRSSDAHVYRVDSQKKIFLPKHKPGYYPSEYSCYRIGRVSIIKHDNTGVPFLDHNCSTFHVLRITEGGQFQVWELGLLLQRGELFFTYHPSWRGELIFSGGEVCCPAAKGRVDLEQFVVSRFTGDPDLLPGQVNELDLSCGLLPGQARVDWFNPWLGYGFAVDCAGQSVMFHETDIGEDGFVDPQQGCVLSYESLIDPSSEGMSPRLSGVSFAPTA